MSFEAEMARVDAPPRPDSHLIMAILCTLFGFWPVGIVAIIKAAGVDSAYDRGDYDRAYELSREAKKFSLISFGIVAIALGLYVFWMVFLIGVGAMLS